MENYNLFPTIFTIGKDQFIYNCPLWLDKQKILVKVGVDLFQNSQIMSMKKQDYIMLVKEFIHKYEYEFNVKVNILIPWRDG
jgi:hypothetical protein